MKKAKYLEIILDNQINFADHIKNIETKVARSIGILSKLSYYLPNLTMLQLYYSLVHPNLLYGVALWGNTFPSYRAKLTPLQKKAIISVTSSDWNVCLFHNTNVLPFSELNKFEIAKIVFNNNNNCLPFSLDHYFTLAKNSHSRLTRFSTQEQMVIPFLQKILFAMTHSMCWPQILEFDFFGYS